ncbi:hypothetical protein CCHR01_18113 [Colletotrichum chrysophilum]|uniref:Uncharacterized protein n=1 Tax=Colletotrichum chrysophilum TaxID=1836956 RepID=A0AAD9A322_9PEZI|nr:hypothetical protein CCHR01_18113 [Colletotrichum chrysophilum]
MFRFLRFRPNVEAAQGAEGPDKSLRPCECYGLGGTIDDD